MFELSFIVQDDIEGTAHPEKSNKFVNGIMFKFTLKMITAYVVDNVCGA